MKFNPEYSFHQYRLESAFQNTRKGGKRCVVFKWEGCNKAAKGIFAPHEFTNYSPARRD